MESKEDCKSNIVADATTSINAPSFVRLFVIQRIIGEYIDNIVDDDGSVSDNVAVIDKLASVFDNDEQENKILVCNILSRLINDGIKTYMNKWYDEKEQLSIIENIFDKIILKQFSNEYNTLITYISNNQSDHKYQTALFNSQDLMSNIFQFLEYGKKFDGDLVSCSLVNSHWLYHVLNINSVYYVDLSRLALDTYAWEYGMIKKELSQVLRMWQRLTNAKHIYFHGHTLTMSDTEVSRLLMFKNVHKINIEVNLNGLTENSYDFDRIIAEWQNKIEWCNLRVIEINLAGNGQVAKENVSSPLKLLNARYIKISDPWYYRIWSNKCKKLAIQFADISENWFNFVIKNCDCSGIEWFYWADVTFNDKIPTKEPILKQFALKFVNLKRLKLHFDIKCETNTLSLLKLLRPIISKNNGKIEVSLGRFFYDWDKIWNDNQFKFDKISLYMLQKSKALAVKVIQDKMKHGLKHLSVEIDPSVNLKCTKYVLKMVNDASFESINVFELKCGIHAANNILSPKMMKNENVKKKLFIDANSSLRPGNEDDSTFLQDFEHHCQILSRLLNEGISFNGKIQIKDYYSSDQDLQKRLNQYLSIYSKYFENDQLLNHCQIPNCDMMVCRPFKKPLCVFESYQTEFGYHECCVKVSNVEQIDHLSV